MTVYLETDRQRMAQHVTATLATVTEMIRKIEAHGHKLKMDNFFHPLNYLVTWQRKRFTVVRLSGQTGEAHHKT